jgi:hypothetical protein
MPDNKPTLFATLTEYLYCLIVLLSIAALFLGVFWLFAPIPAERSWYSFTKHVPRTRVFVSQRPTDCYVEQALPGSKKSHCQKVVHVGKNSSGETQVTVYWQKVSQ